MFRKICSIIILSCLLLTDTTRAQKIYKQDASLFAANVLFGGFSSGFGAVINKQKDQKFLPVFFKGFKYGCLGGSLLYVGKKMSNLIYRDENYLPIGGWGSKIVHNAGASIMENVALHRPPFSHYNLYVGFLRVEMDWQKRFKVQPKLLPLNVAAIFYAAGVNDGAFDLKKSLQTGSLYFITDNDGYRWNGITFKSSVTIQSYMSYNQNALNYTTAHENGHVLQSQEYLIFNTYLQKPVTKFAEKYKWFETASKWVYFDASVFDGAYLIARDYAGRKGCHYYNPYEFEASRMAVGQHMYLENWCR